MRTCKPDTSLSIFYRFLIKNKLTTHRLSALLGINPRTCKKYLKWPSKNFTTDHMINIAGQTSTPPMVIFALINGISQRQALKWYMELEETTERLLNNMWTVPVVDKPI